MNADDQRELFPVTAKDWDRRMAFAAQLFAALQHARIKQYADAQTGVFYPRPRRRHRKP